MKSDGNCIKFNARQAMYNHLHDYTWLYNHVNDYKAMYIRSYILKIAIKEQRKISFDSKFKLKKKKTTAP